MLYTIGNTENYDKLLVLDNLYKSIGGSVWKNLSSVIRYFQNSKVYIGDLVVEGGIYLVDGDWNIDVMPIDNFQGNLNKSCKILKRIV